MLDSRDMWTYRLTIAETADVDLDGFDVEARNGSIGEIDEATHDVGGAYVW